MKKLLDITLPDVKLKETKEVRTYAPWDIPPQNPNPNPKEKN